MDAELAAYELQKSGLELTWTRVETEEAFLASLDPAPDIILADFRLPQFDALQALELLRMLQLDVPLIVVSGTLGDEMAARCIKLGAVDYLIKDRLARLGQAVRQAINEKRERDRASRTQEALRMSEERYRRLFQDSRDAIFITTGEGRILDVNQATLDLFGYDKDEIIELSIEDLLVDPVARQAFHDEIESHRSVKDFEILCKDRDGASLDCVISATVRLGVDGRVAELQGIIRDITHQKQAEKSLRDANRSLEEAMTELRQTQEQIVQQERLRALGAMASGVAHDFNNALAQIVGFADILLTEPEILDDRDRALGYLRNISTSALDAGDVVARLSEFYRYRDDSDLTLPIEVPKLVAETISLTSPKWREMAQAKGVSIELRSAVDENVPVIYGNERSLRTALTNLVFNAVDAMPTGGVLTISACRNSDTVELRVTDTGDGMTEEVQRRAMDPFFTTKGELGTGLGLSMVYGIATRHGGELDIESTQGEGTTVILRFPLKQMTEQVVGDAPGVHETRPLRILVAEDEPSLRNLLIEYLSIDGHFPVGVANGREAVEVLQNQKFDLVVTDRSMPEIAGDDLAISVKTGNPSCPVIMLTGFGRMMRDAGERPTGVDFLLNKPVTVSAMREAIAAVVGQESPAMI